LPKFTGASTIGNSLFTDNGTHGAFGGANYTTGTDVRSFNISSPLYTGLGFWANNVYTGDIFSYGFTGNLLINADPTNVFASTKIAFSVDGTERLGIFSNGNVTIANSPTDNGFKLDVNGTGRFSDTIRGSKDGAGNLNTGTTGSYLILSRIAGGAEILGFRNTGASNGIGGIGYTAQIISDGNDAFEIYTTGLKPLIFGTNANERMRITSGGNVGIGTDSPNSNSILTITAGTSISCYWKATNTNVNTRDWSIITNNANFGDFAIRQGNSQGADATTGTDRLTITSGGNVLINTLSNSGERLNLNGRIGIVGATVASGNTRSFFVRGSQNVADGGTLSISVANTALIFIAENNTGTGALFFCGYASATIVKISDPSNMFDIADTAGKLCIFKSGVTDVATVKNRLGSSKNITVSYIGVSD
jgi:hypothetical protein